MFQQIEENAGQIPDRLLADAGYYSRAKVEVPVHNRTEPLIASRRTKHSDKLEMAPRGRIPKTADVVDRMRRRFQTIMGRRAYAKRRQSEEPALAQIKQVRGFRQFLLRGLRNVRAEWNLICLTHNILRMWRSGKSVPVRA
jgi:hypothetical protein